ncbi:hypothetical protein EON80_12420 [bacterium]|nr:MAG: hypothetical protein EON80_12420 [bacterium]
MKRREMLWMILPCLALVTLGFALRGRDKPASTVAIPRPTGPLQLEVQQVSFEPWKELIVPDGPNTRMRVHLTCKNPAPAGWGTPNFGEFYSDTRLSVHRGGRSVRLMDNSVKTFKGQGIPIEICGFDKKRNAYVFDFVMNTRVIPRSYGMVKFESEWFQRPGDGHYSAVGEKSFAYLRRIGAPHATGSISFYRSH